MVRILFFLLIIIMLSKCNKIDDFNDFPELTPLEDGFKASTAIAYSVSIAERAFTGQSLPSNVVFTGSNKPGYTSSGIIHISADDQHPIPFNSKIGDITIVGLWNGDQGGVVSIIFSDFDLASSDFKFYGIHTIPVTVNPNGDLISIFAKQDIIIGEGSDTLLNLSLSNPKFNLELERLNDQQPSDVFTAVQQNIWHISINQSSSNDALKDAITINGGGQIAEARSNSGGLLYHAMINTVFSHNNCADNPTHGTAFVQNLKAGTILDFGTVLLDFHSACDGKAEVNLATGKYAAFNNRNVLLEWQ